MKLGMLPRRSSSVCIFTAALVDAEMRPRKHRQAQIDGRRVQRVDGVRQIQPEVLAGIQLSCAWAISRCAKVGVDAPVARLVGIGQRRAPNRLAKAHVIELGRLRRQTGLDVAQALAVGQLGEGHHPELLRAGQRPHACRHHSAQRSGRMWSTAGNPSAARTASCRCSWRPPGENLADCPNGNRSFKSTPPFYRSEIRVSHGFQRFDHSFNRTAVFSCSR